jgi:hypothetical protein
MPSTDHELSALQRLWRIAHGDTGQCKVVAKFLLGLFNGQVYPFDLTDFRGLDQSLFQDCLTVLALDRRGPAEIHVLLDVTGEEFLRLAQAWGITGAED